MSDALYIRDVSVAVNGLPLLEGVNVDVAGGAVTAVIGRNGAGKTTLFNAISGLIPLSTGSILWAGCRLDGRTPDAIARLGVGRQFQDMRLFPSLTAREHVVLANTPHKRETLISAFRPVTLHPETDDAASFWLERVGLAEKADALPSMMSYGQQKLLAIARLLAGGARVLLLDEPMAGVAPAMRQTLSALISSIANDLGHTVLLIEHDLILVQSIAATTIAMEDGRVLNHGPTAAMFADGALSRSLLGFGHGPLCKPASGMMASLPDFQGGT
jgi:ABC-type branched-subunit amino acid transport system ATPase component